MNAKISVKGFISPPHTKPAPSKTPCSTRNKASIKKTPPIEKLNKPNINDFVDDINSYSNPIFITTLTK